jgi:hypothetical protein
MSGFERGQAQRYFADIETAYRCSVSRELRKIPGDARIVPIGLESSRMAFCLKFVYSGYTPNP